MSEEEIIGMLRLMQERQSRYDERLALVVDILTRMEQRQIEVKKEIEAEPTQGSFGNMNQ